MCAIQYSALRKDVEMSELEKTYENALLELRRGTLLLSVLSQLDQPHYGYELVQILASLGINVDQNTLYPLLRRLEEQGIVKSDWSVEGSRPRKYYSISDEGKELFKKLGTEWKKISKTIRNLLDK